MVDTKKKSFTHILTRYVSALCSARLSIGKLGWTVAKPERDRSACERVKNNRKREASIRLLHT